MGITKGPPPAPLPVPPTRRPPSQGGIHGGAVRRFVATLDPDAVTPSSALWHRYRAWAASEAPDAARLSEALFGRLLGEDERMARGRTPERRICYRRLRAAEVLREGSEG